MASIVSFFQPRARRTADWSSQELAEFYRVESALVQSGVKVETDRGLSDEGDPWFVFCRGEDGDVIIHLARIDDTYVVASAAFEGVLRGRDFRTVVMEMLERHPLVVARSQQRTGPRLLLHPAALLTALVATAFFKLGEQQAHAATLDDTGQGDRGQSGRTGFGSWLDGRQVAVIAAAVTLSIAIEEIKSGNDKALLSADEQTQRPDGDASLAATLAQVQPSGRTETADRASLLEALRVANAGAPAAQPESGGDAGGVGTQVKVAMATVPGAGKADGGMPGPDAGKMDTIATSVEALIQTAALDDSARPHDAHGASGSGGSAAPADRPSQAGQVISHLAQAGADTLMSTAMVLSQASITRDDVVRFVLDMVTAVSSSSGHAGSAKVALGSGLAELQHELSSLSASLVSAASSNMNSVSTVGTAAATLAAAAATETVAVLALANTDSLVHVPQSMSTLAPVRDAALLQASTAISTAPERGSSTSLTAPVDSAKPEVSSLGLFDDLARDLVSWFIEHNPDAQLVISGSNYVLLDTDVMAGDAHDLTVRSWSLPDDSTISLIGVIPPTVVAQLAVS